MYIKKSWIESFIIFPSLDFAFANFDLKLSEWSIAFHFGITVDFAFETTGDTDSFNDASNECRSVPEPLREPSEVDADIVFKDMIVLFCTVYRLLGRSCVEIGGLVLEQKLEHNAFDVLHQHPDVGWPLGDQSAGTDQIVDFEANIEPYFLQSLYVIILFVVLVALLDQLAEKEVKERKRRSLHLNIINILKHIKSFPPESNKLVLLLNH